MVKLILSTEEQAHLRELMRHPGGYDGLVEMIGRHAGDAMQVLVYTQDDDRDFRAGYAAALLQLREALAQCKTKVYAVP